MSDSEDDSRNKNCAALLITRARTCQLYPTQFADSQIFHPAAKLEEKSASMWCWEYWMIYRGSGFLAIVWFGSFPSSFSAIHSKIERDNLLTENGGGGMEVVGEEPNHTTERKPGPL